MIAGFQGEPGAFSELAVHALLGDVDMRGYRTFSDVLDGLSAGEIAYAVLPYENTAHGPIAAVQHLVAARARVRISGEAAVRVEQCLLGLPDARLDDVDTVVSHPVALTQCRRFLRDHPGWHVAESDDTAGAVREMMQGRERATAAIAAAAAAERYGARLLLRGIQDDPDNITRFWLITREQ